LSNHSFLLLNILVNLVPILFIQLGSQRTVGRPNAFKLIHALSWAAPLIGCSLFPFEIGSGISYSLKFIPLIAGTLYGGFAAGIVLSSLAAALATENALILFLICMVVVIVVAKLRGPFGHFAFPLRLAAGSAVSFVAVLLLWGFASAQFGDRVPWHAVGFFALLQTSLLLLVLSLTEHIREQMRRLKETVRMEKLTANSSLAVIIAHELRNPLTTVNGFLQLIKRQKPSEQIVYYANTAIQELAEAEKIIDTYLTIMALNRSEKSLVRLRPCVEQALREIRPILLQKHIDLQNTVDPEVSMECNAEQMELCLMHLLRNGAHALHSFGRLSIATQVRGKELSIVVTDNGIGMTEEQLEELGVPKYNTRSSGAGTGLMYCYHFVHSLRGRLRIQSQPGRGTTVTMTFPLSVPGPQ